MKLNVKIHWKEICKFLSGAFFVTAGASWYFSYLKFDIPFMRSTMSHQFLFIRGFIHFTLFLITFYFGFIRKQTNTNSNESGTTNR
ncbi:MAG: hypothetical protein WBP41_19915 [Saprospiraceae bacterium]